ncbi:hypothetical protein GN244_ATG04320 [Phytophthora infestans]|uniref:Uncharacterized protein n=1 Tax=Phytophthora infestans TaxID=4787 RepID=A0A833WJI9_PHYIN|nr:hypothetical protein GN244_ATG04320 [Phytophthora infestans]
MEAKVSVGGVDLWHATGRYELRETASRLMRSCTLKRRRNHSVRAILRRQYIDLKAGGMSGSVPECVNRGLLKSWPDTYKVKAGPVIC